jgi:serine/threonine protein kinase
MSRKNIIHRDLKPENILLHSKNQGNYDIRIADFGFAIFAHKIVKADDPDEEIICGTPGYIAPEALEGKGYTLKSDIFSVGSILYNILTLKNLFNGKNYHNVM